MAYNHLDHLLCSVPMAVHSLCTNKAKILKRWAAHFDNVLNRPSSMNEAAIAHLPQADTNMTLAQPIIDDEVKKAINKLLNVKVPGDDAIPAEVFKNGGSKLIKKLTELFNIMLQQECIPQDFKDRRYYLLLQRAQISCCSCAFFTQVIKIIMKYNVSKTKPFLNQSYSCKSK